MAEKEKVVYTKPTSQLDLEARQEAAKKGENPFAVADAVRNPASPDETKDLYVGTDPVYQNHANDTEAPKQSEKGAEKDSEQQFLKAYDTPEVIEKNRKAVDEGKPESQKTRRNTARDDRRTKQASPLFGVDPGSGDGVSDEDDEEEKATPSTPPSPPAGQRSQGNQ